MTSNWKLYGQDPRELEKARFLKKKGESRAAIIDECTIRGCYAVMEKFLGTLKKHHALKTRPELFENADSMYDITFVRSVYPLVYSRCPDVGSISKTFVAEQGVRNFQTRMLASQYRSFTRTMNRTATLKNELLEKTRKQACILACHEFKEELVARVFHPRNLERWVEQGIEDMMFGY